MVQNLSVWNSSVFEICCMKDLNLFMNKFMPIHVWCCKWPDQKFSLLQWVLYDRDFTGYGKLIWVSNISLCFISLRLMLQLRPSNLLDLPDNLKLFTMLFLSFTQSYFEGHVLWMQSKNMVTDMFTYCVFFLWHYVKWKWYFMCQKQISLLRFLIL